MQGAATGHYKRLIKKDSKMPSVKSRIFNFMMRNRHLFRGKLKRERFDFNTSIPDFREQCERSATKYSKIPI